MAELSYKKLIICFSLTFISNLVYSQSSDNQGLINQGIETERSLERDYSKTYLDLGVGFGPNYGLIGVKMVIGYKGNGLLLGFGGFDGESGTAVGLQLAYGAVYLSYANAVYGVYEVSVNGNTSNGVIKGTVIMIGGRPSLGEKQRLILDLGVGRGTGGSVPSPFGEIAQENTVFTIGLGYKF